MTTQSHETFEDRLLASLTAIDSSRPRAAESVALARRFGTRPLLRPALLGIVAALAIAGGALASGALGLLFDTSPLPQVAGDTLAAKGTGCAGNATVTVSLDNRAIGTVSANGTGDFSAAVPIPADATAGRHALAASCADASGRTVTQTSSVEITRVRPPLGRVFNATLVYGAPGGTTVVRVGPVKAGTDVTLTLDGAALPTAHATAEGWLDVTVALPSGISLGEHAIRATGTVPDGRAFDQTTEVEIAAK